VRGVGLETSIKRPGGQKENAIPKGRGVCSSSMCFRFLPFCSWAYISVFFRTTSG